jgi:hypothetical protein
VIYMNSKPENDPRRWSMLREYERFVETMHPPRAARVPLLQKPLVDLLIAVAEELGTTPRAMRSRSRRRAIVLARVVFCRRAYATGRYSTTQVGQAIQREHTSVSYFLGQLTEKHPAAWIEREISERGIKV